MKPVRRRVRNHFGLTAKQVAVRSHRPWYFQSALACIFVVLGFSIAFWMLRNNDYETISKNLVEAKHENKELESKLIQAQRELQVELATNNNLAKELATVQDENIKIKEDLFFYKNMLNKKAN